VLLVCSTLGLLTDGSGISVAWSSGGASSAHSQEFPMKIRLHVDGQVVTTTLYDNATVRDFAALLPLSLTLENYAVIERISNLPRKLSTAGAPAGMKPETGDITYYAPWSNLAIFAGGNVYARGLLPLGKVDTGLPALQRFGPLKVRIERIED
jgi:hypothetical protein